jgi:hypothetical protein
MLALISSEGVQHERSVYSVVIQRSGDVAKIEVFHIAGEELHPVMMAGALREAAARLDAPS